MVSYSMYKDEGSITRQAGLPKVIVFDLDGLMFDTERIALEQYTATLRDFGFSPPEHLLSEIAGLSEHDVIRKLTDFFGSPPAFPIDEIRRERTRRADTLFKTQGMFPKKGLFHLLDYIEAIGIPKVVATSSSRERAEMKLSLGLVRERFPIVITGDDVERTKPAPDIFLKASQLTGASSNQCLVLEDSNSGIRAAISAGMRTIAVPDLQQPDPRLLPELERICLDLDEVRHYLTSLPAASF